MKIAKVKIRKLLVNLLSLFLIIILYANQAEAFLSIKDEAELGEGFLKKIQSQFEFAEYPYLVEYINGLGLYIGKQIEVPYFPLNCYVIKDSTINAFAAPAGHVFFFSGLINIMDTVDELASVLSHELGHVSGRHLALRMERSKKIGLATMAGILAGALIGGDVAGAIMTGSIAAGIQAELGYSRDNERQADQLGLKYASISGFDPWGMVSILKKMQKERWYSQGNMPSYLLTHPGAAERMSNIETMAKNARITPESKESQKFRLEFPLFHTMVMALCSERSFAIRQFNNKLQKDSNSPIAHYGLGLILEQEGSAKDALSHFEIARERMPNSMPILFSAAKAYQDTGQYTKSLPILREALDKSPKDKAIMNLLALSLQKLELYEEALTIYKRLTFLPPVEDCVYYNLGLIYGRQGKLSEAHYNLGIYFKRQERLEKARFHFKKAKELNEGDHLLMEKLDEAVNGLVN
jgi:beta-barrel assembly-enhancing protease